MIEISVFFIVACIMLSKLHNVNPFNVNVESSVCSARQTRNLTKNYVQITPCLKYFLSIEDSVFLIHPKYRTDPTLTEEALRTAVKEELDGPRRLLGYHAMTNKIRQQHNL